MDPVSEQEFPTFVIRDFKVKDAMVGEFIDIDRFQESTVKIKSFLSIRAKYHTSVSLRRFKVTDCGQCNPRSSI